MAYRFDLEDIVYGRLIIHTDFEINPESPLIDGIKKTRGVENIEEFKRYSIILSKGEMFDWEDITIMLIPIFEGHYEDVIFKTAINSLNFIKLVPGILNIISGIIVERAFKISGSQEAAAKLLGISRRTVQTILEYVNKLDEEKTKKTKRGRIPKIFKKNSL